MTSQQCTIRARLPKVSKQSLAAILTSFAKKRAKGVYSFWTGNGQCLYIGRSVNLAQRIPSSFRERIPIRQHGNVYLRTAITATASDMAVAEVALIATHKPSLNRDSKFDDELTLSIEIPVLSSPIVMEFPAKGLLHKLQRISADYFDHTTVAARALEPT